MLTSSVLQRLCFGFSFGFSFGLCPPLILGCGAAGGGSTAEDSADDGAETLGPGGFGVYITDWVTAFEADFDIEEMRELYIGGEPKDSNFINRGDIEVYFTTEDTIEVEYRKFIIAQNRIDAEGNLQKFDIWSWSKSPPVPPHELEDSPELACNNDHWHDGCHIRTWYPGQKQPDRLGMDFRVYLPRNWEGLLVLWTSDSLAEKDVYPDRGDITVKGLSGSLEVHGQGGNVRISRAADRPEVVGCNADDLQKCQEGDWDRIGSDDCPCDQFGSILVDMASAANVNITLNHESMLTQVNLLNQDETLKQTSKLKCEAFFDCGRMENCDEGPIEDREEVWRLLHSANVPASAQKGIGFQTMVTVKGCAEVEYVSGAEDFGAAKTEARGFINVCAQPGRRCPEIEAP